MNERCFESDTESKVTLHLADSEPSVKQCRVLDCLVENNVTNQCQYLILESASYQRIVHNNHKEEL